MPLLISFCNQTERPECSLLLIDEITQGARWIGLPQACSNHVGCTGMEGACGFTYVLTQAAANPHLVVYDRFFRVLHATVLPRVRDPHSLCFLEGFLYLVSTANNSVYRIRLSTSGIPMGEPELHWSYQSGAGSDEDLIHLNSIGAVDGQLYVTCFGSKVEQTTWKTTTNGLCINISDGNRVVVEGLYHPHAVKFEGATMLVCSSGSFELVCLEPAGGRFQIQTHRQFDGYIRGLAYSKEFYFVGQSGGRQVSRSRGTKNLADDIGSQSAKVHLLSRDLSQSDREIDISPYGSEIYDILYLPHLPFSITDTSGPLQAESAAGLPGQQGGGSRVPLSRWEILYSLKQDGRRE